MLRIFIYFFSLIAVTTFAQSNANEEFIQAIKNNTYNLEMLSNINISYQNIDGENFLSLAAYYGREDLVRSLIEKGVKVDYKETNGTTPLMNAAFMGHLNIVELLSASGADLNKKNIYLYTPLIKAVLKNQTNVVAFLLSNDVKINHQDEMGNTALHYAVMYFPTKDSVEPLLTNANLKLKNVKKLTAFEQAIQDGHANIIQLFLEYDTNLITQFKNFKGHDQLIYNLVASDRRDLLDLAIKQGASLNVTNSEQVPALHVAISLGLRDMVDYILDQGLSIELTSPFGDSPLTMAVYSEEFDIVSDLINKGANINHSEKNGDTPILIAIRRKNKKITELLLAQENLNLDAKNIYEDDALSIAKDSNDPELYIMVDKAIQKYREGQTNDRR
ncbi:MAG: ankyrin repeat domain-containing protein [Brevinema sp.]